MQNTILHQITLKNIGGVQKAFIDYYHFAITWSKYLHKIYGMDKIDQEYCDVRAYKNMSGSLYRKIRLLEHIISSGSIVHFYNNLPSKVLMRILKYLPSKNIVLHERGRAWNESSDCAYIYQAVTEKADVVLVNSKATQIMLRKKFSVSGEKIIVLYNGLAFPEDGESSHMFKKHGDRKKQKVVAFIGRLDTPKAPHVFIKMARMIGKRSDIVFKLAGDGPMKSQLVEMSGNVSNIQFVGRVRDPYSFIASADVLVVPSIREPLGNVCIEAGFCKTPVIAALIDGIPEIIDDGISGRLLAPGETLTAENVSNTSARSPEYVVDPVRGELVEPKEIHPEILVDAVLELLENKALARMFAENLYKKVKAEFCVSRYAEKLESIYDKLLEPNN